MAIDVEWTTGVITIPKADTTLVTSTPSEIREYDLNTLKGELKDLEASVDGIVWPDTHRHDTTKTISGLVLARSIEIIPPYTVTFEDGTYSVNLFGANHNIVDRNNKNQVSLVTQNSAGLIDQEAKRGVIS